MALSEIRVIILDLDTVLTSGLDDVYATVAKTWKKEKRPSLWIWIPEGFSGFYSNKALQNVKYIDFFLCGKLDIGDFQPHQVLVFSKSVKTLLPIREQKICQTVIGDSLTVITQTNNKFSNKYKVEFSESQLTFLRDKVKSKIYRYLKTDCSTVEELNRSMWIQEKCEGVAVLGRSNALVAISQDAINEWEGIFKSELSMTPPLTRDNRDDGSGTHRSGVGPGSSMKDRYQIGSKGERITDSYTMGGKNNDGGSMSIALPAIDRGISDRNINVSSRVSGSGQGQQDFIVKKQSTLQLPTDSRAGGANKRFKSPSGDTIPGSGNVSGTVSAMGSARRSGESNMGRTPNSRSPRSYSKDSPTPLNLTPAASDEENNRNNKYTTPDRGASGDKRNKSKGSSSNKRNSERAKTYASGEKEKSENRGTDERSARGPRSNERADRGDTLSNRGDALSNRGSNRGDDEEDEIEKVIRSSLKMKTKEDLEMEKAIKESMWQEDPDELAAAIQASLQMEKSMKSAEKKLAEQGVDLVD